MPAGLRAASRILWIFNLPSSSNLYRRKSDSLLLHRVAHPQSWYQRKSDHRQRQVAPPSRYHRRADRRLSPLRMPYQRTRTLRQADPCGPLRSLPSLRMTGPFSPRPGLSGALRRHSAPTLLPWSPPRGPQRLTRRLGWLFRHDNSLPNRSPSAHPRPRLSNPPRLRYFRKRDRTPSFSRLLTPGPRTRKIPLRIWMIKSHLDPAPSFKTRGSHGSICVMRWGCRLRHYHKTGRPPLPRRPRPRSRSRVRCHPRLPRRH